MHRPQPLPRWADPDVPADALDAQSVSRRGLLRRAGLYGAAFAGAAYTVGAASAPAEAHAQPHGGNDPHLVYLAGDHHIHSVYSHDAKYTFSQLATAAARYGLDWMVLTEHSNIGHHKAGGAEAEHREIRRARAENRRMLIFQGLEWYIPGAEHATVFSAPGRHEVDLLTRFEQDYDGKLLGYTDGAPGHPDTPRNEAHAVKALKWLDRQRRRGYVDDVLVLANHPLRLGINSPHEMRAWRDAAPDIMIGMEGAPGSQGAAHPGRGASSIRGEYENSPSANSFPGYPLDAYVTYGGFDWATATVGGLWDAMLAEGKLFSITSNSDVHRVVFDTWRNGDWPPGRNFDNTGRLPDPVDTTEPQPGSDLWPGQFSRTHVGVTRYGYRHVMAGLRAGRVWVDHGQLVDGLDVRVSRAHGGHGRGVTLGGRLRVRRGEQVTLTVTVTTASRPNHHGELPRLAHLDVIRGAANGPAADRDAWRAPDTRVVHTADVSGRRGRYTLRVPLGRIEESCYVRLRGSDGRRNGPGLLGATIDPHGPIRHEPGNGDPWVDTWLYTNPVFVDVVPRTTDE
ncbi:PHP domain-containing protein [Streptomyces lasiicapitis]|uniref:PHP domain-containing protein n=1 Tax=Streptomyces lasiicapitis TaxID=1923961 RepID=UPI00331F62C6